MSRKSLWIVHSYEIRSDEQGKLPQKKEGNSTNTDYHNLAISLLISHLHNYNMIDELGIFPSEMVSATSKAIAPGYFDIVGTKNRLWAADVSRMKLDIVPLRTPYSIQRVLAVQSLLDMIFRCLRPPPFSLFFLV